MTGLSWKATDPGSVGTLARMTQYAARRMAVDVADPEPSGLASEWADHPTPRHALPDDSGPQFQTTPVRFDEERYDRYTPGPVASFESVGGLPLYRPAAPAYQPDGPSGPREVPPVAYQPVPYPTLPGGPAMPQPAPYLPKPAAPDLTDLSAMSALGPTAGSLVRSFSLVTRIISGAIFLVVAVSFTVGATHLGGFTWYAAGFAWLIGIVGVLKPALFRPRARIRL